ncbi:MAG TPA: hypothetical protein VGF67_29335 [Ktedonobacteraceae bacterium]|jgi:hypothetical protein
MTQFLLAMLLRREALLAFAALQNMVYGAKYTQMKPSSREKGLDSPSQV